MFRKSVYLLLAIAVLASLIVACAGAPEPTKAPAAAKPAASGTVYKIGTNAEYPPFESVDKAGKVVGFDADLIAAIAEKAGFKYEFVNTRWDGIFVALQSGEFDAVASACTITDERAQIVNFSNPYFDAGQMIAVRVADKDKITKVSDLDGKKVGVQLGTTGDIWLSANSKAEIVRYDEITLAFQAMANNTIDVVFNDAPVSAEIIRANPEMKAVLVGQMVTDERYGIAVNKGKAELLKMINDGLAKAKADGTYDQIVKKWVPAMAK